MRFDTLTLKTSRWLTCVLYYYAWLTYFPSRLMAEKSAVISQLSKIFWQFLPPIFFMGVQRYMPIYFHQNISELFRKLVWFFIFFKRSSRYRKWIAKIGTDSFPTNFSPPFLFTFASQSTNNFQRSDMFFFKCGAQRYGHGLSFPSIL